MVMYFVIWQRCDSAIPAHDDYHDLPSSAWPWAVEADRSDLLGILGFRKRPENSLVRCTAV